MATVTPARPDAEINSRTTIAVITVIRPTVAVVAVTPIAIAAPMAMVTMAVPSAADLLDLRRRIGFGHARSRPDRSSACRNRQTSQCDTSRYRGCPKISFSKDHSRVSTSARSWRDPFLEPDERLVSSARHNDDIGSLPPNINCCTRKIAAFRHNQLPLP